jgi:hypothetical protein
MEVRFEGVEDPHFPNVPHLPNVPHSPGTLPPKCRALLLCISYSICPDGSDPGNRPSPLGGPLNDAKEVKATLIGELDVDSTAFSPLSRSRSIELFHYHEEGIFVMTDEGKNVGTEHWPSKENIVRIYFPRGVVAAAYSLTLANKSIQLQAMDNLVRDATPGDAFVFYCASSIVGFCATLSSSVDLISIDAGHGGTNDEVGDNRACAYKSDFSRCLVFRPSN